MLSRILCLITLFTFSFGLMKWLIVDGFELRSLSYGSYIVTGQTDLSPRINILIDIETNQNDEENKKETKQKEKTGDEPHHLEQNLYFTKSLQLKKFTTTKLNTHKEPHLKQVKRPPKIS